MNRLQNYNQKCKISLKDTYMSNKSDEVKYLYY